MSKLNFFELNERLLNLGTVNTPSEVHGLICGQLVSGKKLTDEEWLEQVVKHMDIEHVELSEDDSLAIQQINRDTQSDFASDELVFSPLLPEDESTLIRRTQELGHWCEGFLHGLGLSGLAGETKLSSEASDVIRDLAQISQVELEEEEQPAEQDEENERAFFELVEYVKIAVLNIYAELSGDSPSESAPTIH